MARYGWRVKGGKVRARRTVLFVGIALALPLAACKWLSKGEDLPDAAPSAPSSPGANQANATASTPAPAAPGASGQVAPLASGSAGGGSSTPPHAGSARPVVVRLPDGGRMTVDASVGPDGKIELPPGFQFPTFPSFPGFDAAALKIPAFDAASLPPMPSGFPKIPGFGGTDGGK
ncbi:hypothetical protein [Pendulispora albinea]|uniref:Lipoprotein n=1 Tax=Pendulispora albinea TaxID=2741071 RepID=A0ABZ2LT78_9BACT